MTYMLQFIRTIIRHPYYNSLKKCILQRAISYNGMNHNKILIASQARLVNKYKNLKHNVLKCNASMYFKNSHIANVLIFWKFAFMVPDYGTDEQKHVTCCITLKCW